VRSLETKVCEATNKVGTYEFSSEVNSANTLECGQHVLVTVAMTFLNARYALRQVSTAAKVVQVHNASKHVKVI
jgi:hypothetical protein